MTDEGRDGGSDRQRDVDGANGRDPVAFRDAVREGYDGLADVYDAQRADDPALPLLEGLLDGLGPSDRALDVGCGSGRAGTERLAARCETVGLDVSREQLRLAADREIDALCQGDAVALPFRDGAVDALTEYHAVIHVPKERHGDVYREFARALAPGGEAVVTVGTDDWEGTNPDWLDSGVEMRWSIHDRPAAERLLREAGFSIVEAAVEPDSLGAEFAYLRVRRE